MDSADCPPDPPKDNPFAVHRAAFSDSAGGLDYGRLIDALVAVVHKIDPGLDLSTLKTVRTSYDYRGLLAEISKEMGRTINATDRSDGVGMAMLVHGKDGDVLALHQGLLDDVLHDDRQRMRQSVHLIHHELGHAHDSAMKRRSFGAAWLSQLGPSGLSYHLFPLADAVWCEYFANRRSYPTWPGGEHMHGPMFAKQISEVPAAVKKAIREFRLHRQVPRLLDEALPYIKFLFMLAGYVMGTVHAAGGSLADLDAGAAAALRGSFFEPAWTALDAELEQMHATHGEWAGLQAYAPLEITASDVMVRLGLVLSLRNGRPYLDVPFTPDTLPRWV
jgi:hypothetical protein